jgi:hypothetical protein
LSMKRTVGSHAAAFERLATGCRFRGASCNRGFVAFGTPLTVHPRQPQFIAPARRSRRIRAARTGRPGNDAGNPDRGDASAGTADMGISERTQPPRLPEGTPLTASRPWLQASRLPGSLAALASNEIVEAHPSARYFAAIRQSAKSAPESFQT